MFRYLVLVVCVFVFVTKADEGDKDGCGKRGPMGKMNAIDCCNLSSVKPEVLSCISTIKQKLSEKEKPDQCLSECVFGNVTKSFPPEEKPNREEILATLNTHIFVDDKWNSYNEKMVDVCLKKLEAKIQNHKDKKPEGGPGGHHMGKCNKSAFFMMMCLHGQYTVNCPEANFNKSNPDCVNLKSHVEKCHAA